MADVYGMIPPHDPSWRVLLLALALGIDAILGEPPWLWRYLPHPVVIFGKAISAMTRWGNKRGIKGQYRRWRGIFGMIMLILIAAIVGSAITFGAGVINPWTHGMASLVIEVMVVAILLAGRSLDDHVRRVATALAASDEDGARFHISMIVGRNPEHLDEPAMARAAIETTAENLSDGVIAPAFFYLVFGLPGILAYKMINTADSMIGYRSKQYYAFGTGAARIDDLANIIPARITGLLIAMASPRRFAPALIAMISDAPKHRSPNAGWPEAAMAAVLNLSLAGPRLYGQRMSTDPAMHPQGRRDAHAKDIQSALMVMWRVIAIVVIGLLVFSFA